MAMTQEKLKFFIAFIRSRKQNRGIFWLAKCEIRFAFYSLLAIYAGKRQILPANYRTAQSTCVLRHRGETGDGSTWHFNARLIDGRRAITYYRCEGWVIASEYRQEIGQKLQATALLTLAGKSPAGQIFIVLLSWLMCDWLPTG